MYRAVEINRIPKELRQCNQWILWQGVPQGDGKVRKVPHSPITGRMANAHDPRHWAPFDVAVQKLQEHMLDGIGFVFTADDTFVGIDLDHCIGPDGDVIDEKSRRILKLARSYHEISPSGTGIRIIAKTSRKRFPGDRSGRKKGDYEIYLGKRYLTITGWIMEPQQVRVIDDVIDEIFALIQGDDETQAQLPAKSELRMPKNEPALIKVNNSDQLDDQTIIGKILSHKKGRLLWDGDTKPYKSESEADLALCGLIARYTEDEEQMDRIFRESGLYRDKWDEDRGGMTYGEMTLETALSKVETYWKSAAKRNGSVPFKAGKRFGYFKCRFFEYIVKGTADVEMMREIINVFKNDVNRQLNEFLFPNLAVYIKESSSNKQEQDLFIENAARFIENISEDLADPANLRRWIYHYDELFDSNEKLEFKPKAMLDWAEQRFPGTIVHKLIKEDAERLYRHRQYFSFIEENMNGDSVEEIRARWNEFVGQTIGKAGFH